MRSLKAFPLVFYQATHLWVHETGKMRARASYIHKHSFEESAVYHFEADGEGQLGFMSTSSIQVLDIKSVKNCFILNVMTTELLFLFIITHLFMYMEKDNSGTSQ